MKKLKWIVPAVVLIISLIILFKPAGRTTFDKSVSKNRVVFTYEPHSCGAYYPKILEGGAELTKHFKNEYPSVSIDEICFTENSNEPRKSSADPDFLSASKGIEYIIEGEPVGIVDGHKTCDGEQKNEVVVEFEAANWYYAEYIPYAIMGDYYICSIFLCLLICSLIIIIIQLIVYIVKKVKRCI